MNFEVLKTFQDKLPEIGIAGNDLAIYLDGAPVYRHFSGFQNIEKCIPVSEKTLFKMFSMTKPITCTAAMQLFEKGVFLLNEPVSDYLPEFSGMKVRDLSPDGEEILRDSTRPILIQDLFTMSSGLDYDLQAEPILRMIRETDCRFTTRDAAKAIAEKPLLFEPGTHWHYGLSHDILGALIEVWSGMSFGEYLKRNIFDPLSMDTAVFHLCKEKEKDLCCRYGFNEARELVPGSQINSYQLSPVFESGGAGLIMTVSDYAKFACAMTNRGISKSGVRLLAGKTVDLMRRNFLDEPRLHDLWASSPAREGYGYGLGVRTVYDPAMCGTGFGRSEEFGWGGAWGTYVLMAPESKITVVFGMQGVDTRSIYIQRRLRNMVFAALEWEGLLPDC